MLKALALEPMHGWGIGLRIQEISRGRLDVNQGSLYPALQRLEHHGWVESDWQSTENNRRARYYSSPNSVAKRSAKKSTSGNASPKP